MTFSTSFHAEFYELERKIRQIVLDIAKFAAELENYDFDALMFDRMFRAGILRREEIGYAERRGAATIEALRADQRDLNIASDDVKKEIVVFFRDFAAKIGEIEVVLDEHISAIARDV